MRRILFNIEPCVNRGSRSPTSDCDAVLFQYKFAYTMSTSQTTSNGKKCFVGFHIKLQIEVCQHFSCATYDDVCEKGRILYRFALQGSP